MENLRSKLAALVTMLALLLVPTPSTAGIRARAGVDGCGRILFRVHRNDDRVAIQSIRSDGSRRKTLFVSGEQRAPLHPTWSPKARLVAFARSVYDADEERHEDEIWVMRADGSGATRLSQSGVAGSIYDITWDPNEDRLAFSRVYSDANQPNQIFVVNLEGQERLLVDGNHPAWSPDGDWIAYSTWDGWWDDSGAIFRLGPDGNGNFQVTEPEGATDSYPAWEPDSDGLAFLRYPKDQKGEDGPYADIWSIDFSDEVERQLTDQQDDLNGAWGPEYAPNERRIVFEDASDDYSAIQLMRSDGSDDRYVQEYGYEPEWGRSSRKFAYIHNGRIRTYSIRRDRSRTVLSDKTSAIYDLDWASC